MRILTITPYPPYPPQSGGRIRVWHQLRYLSENHAVTLASLVYTDEETHESAALAEFCEDLHLVRCHGPRRPAGEQPRLVAECNREEMWRRLEGLSHRAFDVVLIEHIYMAQYRPLFLSQRAVIQEHNVESEVMRRYAEIYPASGAASSPSYSSEGAFVNAEDEWVAMARYEASMWPTFDLRIAVSSRDKAVIERSCRGFPTVLVENGTAYPPIPEDVSKAPPSLLFMGTLDYYPNVDAVEFLVREILPLVWAVEPSVRLRIAGRNPPAALGHLAKDARVEIIANPPDMAAVAALCLVSVVPLRIGGGTRIKILDSLAMGLPVVSTSIGCEGLGIMNGIHLAVGDDAPEIARAILRVVGDEEIRRAFRSQGLKFVQRRHQWRKTCEKLESALQHLVSPLM